MTTIHSIIRESLREAAGLADSLMADGLHDTIATDAEAAIRALLTSDAAVREAMSAYYGECALAAAEGGVGGSQLTMCPGYMRAALEAAFKEEG